MLASHTVSVARGAGSHPGQTSVGHTSNAKTTCDRTKSESDHQAVEHATTHRCDLENSLKQVHCMYMYSIRVLWYM